jgi:hypothetical protein
VSARKRAAEWPWKSPTSHNDPMFVDWGEHDSALAYLTIREGHQQASREVHLLLWQSMAVPEQLRRFGAHVATFAEELEHLVREAIRGHWRQSNQMSSEAEAMREPCSPARRC